MKKRTDQEAIIVGAGNLDSWLEYTREQYEIDLPERYVLEVETLGGIVVARVYTGHPEMFCEYLAEFTRAATAPASPAAVIQDSALDDALACVITRDPFGGAYTGRTLREACRDAKWREKASKELKNTYLRDRVDLIDAAIKGGFNI